VSGELVVSHRVSHDTVYGASWSPDGSMVAFGAADHTVRAIDANTGEQRLYQSAHDDWVLDTVFSVDGSHLVSAGRDQTLKLIEVATERFIDNVTSITPGALTGGIQAVDRHPLRDEVLVGGADGVPKIYRMHRATKRVIGDDANLLWQMPALPGRIFDVAYSRDGTRLAAVSSLDGIGTLHVYAMPAEPPLPDAIRDLLFKPTHTRSGEEIAKLNGHFAEHVKLIANVSLPSGAYAVAFTPDGEQVIAGGADGVMHVYRATDGVQLREFVPVPLASAQQAAATTPRGAGDGPSFRTDVMPILARLGCNAGTCHGAKDGKNGFKLSLRGYDPLSDHRALTDDHAGRRTNRAAPAESLMLQKAIGAVPHEGGQRTAPDSEYYAILRDWIAQGMPDNPQAPKVARLEMTPDNPVVEDGGDEVQIEVHAEYTDGSRREVTGESFFSSSDTDVANVSESGRVSAIRRGEAALMVRYEGAYAATTLTVMGDREGFQWNSPRQHNRIDELVDAKLQRVKTLPSELCTDAEFLRRVYLDLTGLPPAVDDVRRFLADERPTRQKRDEVIDRLLASDEYIDYRTNKWADLLQVNSKSLGTEGAALLRDWIRQAVAANMPYDDFARAILTAEGSNRENPPAAYFKTLRTPDALMENTTHLLLGVRFNCNKCHDHPFERWTQDQYYGLAAFFAQTRLEKDPASNERTVGGTDVEAAKPLFETVSDADTGEVKHERTGQVAPPEFPYQHQFECATDATRRERLAAWLTAPQNQYFARSYVNRLWGYLLGRGLIEPIDDIRAGNPPTNPELLDWLTDQFIETGFDTRHILRTICMSRTYQASSRTNRWNEDDRLNFSHATLRRLPAEALYDSVHAAVGAPWQIAGVAKGLRASQLADAQVKLPDLLLDQLGRPARESACECERSEELMLGSVMTLVNGSSIAEAINDPSNVLARLESEIKDDRALVDELFLRILNRPPTAEEVETAVETLHSPADEQAALGERVARLQTRRDAQFDTWLEKQQIIDWELARPRERTTTNGAALRVAADGSVHASGPTGKGKYVVVVDTYLPRIRGLKLEALADDALPTKGPGRSPRGNFVVNELRITASPLDDPSAMTVVGLRNAEASYSQGGYHVRGAIDGNPDTGWAIEGKNGQDVVATFELRGKVGSPSGTRLVIEIEQLFDETHQLGRFRLSLTGSPPPVSWRPREYPVDVAAILRLPAQERTPRQRLVLVEYHRSLDEEITAVRAAIDLVANPRLVGVQDLTWALINTPAFLFNH
jgi:hypothetical protein